MGPCPEGMEGTPRGTRPASENAHFSGAMPGGHGGLIENVFEPFVNDTSMGPCPEGMEGEASTNAQPQLSQTSMGPCPEGMEGRPSE